MFSLFTKGKASLGDPEEFESDETESDLFKDSKIPKIDMKELYGVGILDFSTKRRFRKVEMTFSATKAQTDCFLISQARIDTARGEGFGYLHIGAVQVAFKFRAQKEIGGGGASIVLGGGGASIVAVLRDSRLLRFEQSLISAVQADLNDNEIAYFYVTPGFPVSIRDARAALQLTIKTHAKGLEENVEGLAVGYRVYYKLMKSAIEPGTKLSSSGDFTTLFQTHHPKNRTFRRRRVEWKDIEFPDEWKTEGTKRIHESKEMGSSNVCTPQSQQGSQAMQGENDDNLENARCQLLHWYNFDLEEAVAEGKIASVDPSAKVHHVPVGRDCWKVWVEEVSNENVNLYRPAGEAQFLGEALGSTVAWPKSSIKLL